MAKMPREHKNERGITRRKFIEIFLYLFGVSLLGVRREIAPFRPILAIIPSFSGNERSRGGNAICRDDGRKWASRVVSASVRSAHRTRSRSRLIQGFAYMANRMASG